MKKKILFVLNQMGAGGIAKSLSNLLYHLEKYKDYYDVDLFLLRKDGCYIKDIPEYVNVYEAKGVLKLFGASQKDTRKFGKLATFNRFITACWTKVFSNYIPLKIGCNQNKLQKEYDAAISFTHTQNGHDMAAGSVEFVLNSVKAKKKFCVIHGDVVIENLLNKSNVKKFKKFDRIFSVSQDCSNQVKKVCPDLAEKSDFLYNTQRNDIIKEKADEFQVDLGEQLNLVMISRLEHQKAHLRFLPIVKKLKEDGFDFKLSVVGDGSKRSQIEQYIKENKMEGYVELLGQKQNPYPYFKAAAVFVLVSYYEAAPMVYNESQLLGTPVFTARTLSADEMVGDYGFVCDNTYDGIYSGLKHILSHPELIKEKQNKLKTFDYNNDKIVKKLLSFIS